MGELPRGKGRRGSRGLLSPALLIFLAVMASPLLLLTSLSREENLLSRKYLLQKRARQLAEYAFWEWFTRAQQGGSPWSPPRSPLFGTTSPWASPALRGNKAGGSFEAGATWRSDRGDDDGDPGTTLVLYNKVFGFPSSPFPTGGYPVTDVRVRGVIGRQRAVLDIALTITPYLADRTAALTSAGPVIVQGPAVIDGRLPSPAAAPEPTSSGGVAAVASPGPVTVSGDVVLLDGRENPAADPPLPGDVTSPYAVLGLPPASRYLEKRKFLPAGIQPWTGTTFIGESFRGTILGSGTLVVHNPSFVPAKYLASWKRSRSEEAEGFDPSYDHLDPANQPAVLEPAGESRFEGVVIADDFRPGCGRLDILGQLFILHPLPVTLAMSEGLTIVYRPDSIREFVHGDSDLILAWSLGRDE